jgi:hypothetical protein
MGEIRNADRILVDKPLGKWPLGRQDRRITSRWIVEK